MNPQAIEKRMRAAADLLQAREINRATFESLRSLLSGVHPRTDKLLASLSRELKHMEHVQKGDIIELTLEGLPEFTPQEKKRKKALLLFLKLWNDLKGEVKRIEKELAQAKGTPHQGNARAVGRILSGAKGPLVRPKLLLEKWSQFRTTDWVNYLEYPEFTLKQIQHLLTLAN